VLIGGNGKDRLYGNEGENWLEGEAGSDELYGGNVRDVMLGGSGNDNGYGNSGDDWIVGGSGSDKLYGAGGADVIFGDEYIDGLIAGGAPSRPGAPDLRPDPEAPVPWVISEGRFLYTRDSMTLADDVRDVTAQGRASIKITGNWRDNVIIGNDGKNTIKAGAGNDEINGGYGNDILSGGTGNDTFVFSSKFGSYKSNRKVNYDQITDFSVKNDTILLENKVFTKLTKTGKLNKGFFTIGSEAKDSNDYIIYDKKTGVLSYDRDGSGAAKAIEFAQLKKGLALKYNDFFAI
jgi:Ca2+-binding RTX toxin-like protein